MTVLLFMLIILIFVCVIYNLYNSNYRTFKNYTCITVIFLNLIVLRINLFFNNSQ